MHAVEEHNQDWRFLASDHHNNYQAEIVIPGRISISDGQLAALREHHFYLDKAPVEDTRVRNLPHACCPPLVTGVCPVFCVERQRTSPELD